MLFTIADAPAVGWCHCWVGALYPASQPAIAGATAAATTRASGAQTALRGCCGSRRALLRVKKSDAGYVGRRTAYRAGWC